MGEEMSNQDEDAYRNDQNSSENSPHTLDNNNNTNNKCINDTYSGQQLQIDENSNSMESDMNSQCTQVNDPPTDEIDVRKKSKENSSKTNSNEFLNRLSASLSISSKTGQPTTNSDIDPPNSPQHQPEEQHQPEQLDETNEVEAILVKDEEMVQNGFSDSNGHEENNTRYNLVKQDFHKRSFKKTGILSRIYEHEDMLYELFLFF